MISTVKIIQFKIPGVNKLIGFAVLYSRVPELIFVRISADVLCTNFTCEDVFEW
jgi:hypothetical protein